MTIFALSKWRIGVQEIRSNYLLNNSGGNISTTTTTTSDSNNIQNQGDLSPTCMLTESKQCVSRAVLRIRTTYVRIRILNRKK